MMEYVTPIIFKDPTEILIYEFFGLAINLAGLALDSVVGGLGALGWIDMGLGLIGAIIFIDDAL